MGLLSLLRRVRDLPGHLRWRLAGSPLPPEPFSVAAWAAAYGALPAPRGRRASVSVVTTLTGAALERLLASLASQRVPPREVVTTNAAPAPAGQRLRVVGAEGPGLGGVVARATGDLLLVVSGEATLSEHAVAWFALAGSEADLIYCDEVHTVDGGPVAAVAKPAWSPRMLLGYDLTGPVFAVKRRVAARIPTGDGNGPAAGRDLALRLAELPLRVTHLPLPLVHRPAPQTGSADAAPVVAALARRALRARVEPGPDSRIRFEPLPAPPLVKVVIPTRDRADLLERAARGVLDMTRGIEVALVVVDDGSREEATARLLGELAADPRVTVVRVDEPFNFSRLVNRGAAAGPGASLLLMLNNDVEVHHPDWLLQLSGWLRDPGVAGVGAKLLFPDATIQHAGMAFGLGGIVGHIGLHEPDGPSPGGIPGVAREVSCLTGACLLVRSEDFVAAGGLDEAMPIDFQDVDLCLRLRRMLAGNLMVDPTYPLTHMQMATRSPEEAGSEETIARMRSRWGEVLIEPDPYQSPHLSLEPGEKWAPIPGSVRLRMERARPRNVFHPGPT